MRTANRTALLVLLFAALIAGFPGGGVPAAQAQASLVDYATVCDSMNGDWIACRINLTNPGLAPFTIDRCIVDFLEKGSGKKIATATEIWAPGFDLKAIQPDGKVQMMGLTKFSSSGGGGPVKVHVPDPGADPAPGTEQVAPPPLPNGGPSAEIRTSAPPDEGGGKGEGKRVRERPVRERPVRERPVREKRGNKRGGDDAVPPGTVPDGGGVGLLAAAPAVEAPTGPNKYEPVGKKIGPGQVVIQPGTRSQDLWAYVLLNPPQKMDDVNVEIGAIDADGNTLGQSKAVLPGVGEVPEGVLDQAKQINVYKIEPHKASKYLAVYFNLANRTPNGYFVASVNCRYYGYNAQQPLQSGGRVEAYEASGFKQGGPISAGKAVTAGSVSVNGNSSVNLVINGKARNGPLEVDADTVEGIKIEIITTDGNTIESDRVVFKDLLAKLAGVKPAEKKPPKVKPKPPPDETGTGPGTEPGKTPPDKKPPAKGDDDDDDDDA
ncbi:MAG: hypothetical protein AAB215_03635 [Planctomycetota bacterium]